jgi:hypothetical protein
MAVLSKPLILGDALDPAPANFCYSFLFPHGGIWAGWQWSPLGLSEKIAQGMGILP